MFIKVVARQLHKTQLIDWAWFNVCTNTI